MKPYIKLAFALGLFLLCAYMVALARLSTRNTLAVNGKWLSGKLFVPELMYARNYFTGTQALTGNTLNLDKWTGFQEVYYDKKLKPRRIAFDFSIEADAYVVCFFDRVRDESNVVRFSANAEQPNATLSVKNTGEFISRRLVQPPSIQTNRWNHAEITFSAGEARVSLNGAAFAVLPVSIEAPGDIGFRGNNFSARVDNVEIEAESGIRFTEDFSNRNGFLDEFLYCTGWAILAFMTIGTIQIALRLKAPSIVDNTLALGLCLTSGTAILLFVGVDKSNQNITPPDQAARFGVSLWIQKKMDETTKRLYAEYGNRKAEDEIRIMFIGTSQTLGMGAMNETESFPKRLEAMLQNDFRDRANITCINTGTSAAYAIELFDRYSTEWVNFAPDIVMLNLGVNDSVGNTGFAEAIASFYNFNKARGITTVLSAETSYLPRPELEANRQDMRNTARKENLDFLETDICIRQRNDDGFLFWDGVHMTTHGYQLIAECMRPGLKKTIEETILKKPCNQY